MDKYEKVLKGLKCGICSSCPYFVENCVSSVRADAINILKAQHKEIETLKDRIEALMFDGVN